MAMTRNRYPSNKSRPANPGHVGQTPWSARVPLDPLFVRRNRPSPSPEGASATSPWRKPWDRKFLQASPGRAKEGPATVASLPCWAANPGCARRAPTAFQRVQPADGRPSIAPKTSPTRPPNRCTSATSALSGVDLVIRFPRRLGASSVNPHSGNPRQEHPHV